MSWTDEDRRKYRLDNEEKIREQTTKWRKDNPDKVRNAHLRHKYGISLDDYNRMVEDQNGLCAICRGTCPSGNNLCIDHDHTCCSGGKSCGKCVRRLLCRTCNSVLGLFAENPLRFQAAIDYLEEWN